MNLLNFFTQFLSEHWLPNLVGLIGGLLGAWAFIDNYLIKFKPKIYIGTRIIIDTVTEKGKIQLNSIFCSLELCNHRKKYGVIYDFAVRVYNAEEINSDKAIYYASEIVQKVPIKVEELENQEYDMFNPITILPASNKSINLVLSEVLNRSKMNIATGKSHYLEAYYQKEPKGKWYFIDKLYLFNENSYGNADKKYVQFSVLDNDKTRNKLLNILRPQKTSLYTGASQKYIKNKIRLYKYKLLINPFNRIKDIFISIPFYLNFGINQMYDKIVKIPIIKMYGKKIETVKIKVGMPELKPITLDAFELIYSELQKLVPQINSGAKNEALITLKRENAKILVYRYRLTIEFYLAGDTTIVLHEPNQNFSTGSRLTYSLSLRKGLWGKQYWYLDNHGFITLKSFVIRVMDAFVIHSNY